MLHFCISNNTNFQTNNTVSSKVDKFCHWKAQVLNTSFLEVRIFLFFEFVHNFMPVKNSKSYAKEITTKFSKSTISMINLTANKNAMQWGTVDNSLSSNVNGTAKLLVVLPVFC